MNDLKQESFHDITERENPDFFYVSTERGLSDLSLT